MKKEYKIYYWKHTTLEISLLSTITTAVWGVRRETEKEVSALGGGVDVANSANIVK